MIRYLRVRIGGTPASVQELLDGLPGDHQAAVIGERDDGEYLVATTDLGFLDYAIRNQGYGIVLGEETP